MKRRMTPEEEFVTREIYPTPKDENRRFMIDSELPDHYLAVSEWEIMFSADVLDEISGGRKIRKSSRVKLNPAGPVAKGYTPHQWMTE